MPGHMSGAGYSLEAICRLLSMPFSKWIVLLSSVSERFFSEIHCRFIFLYPWCHPLAFHLGRAFEMPRLLSHGYMGASLIYVTVSSFLVFQSRAITVIVIFSLALLVHDISQIPGFLPLRLECADIKLLRRPHTSISSLPAPGSSPGGPCSCYTPQWENCAFPLPKLFIIYWLKWLCTFFHGNFSSILRINTLIYLKIFLDILSGWEEMKSKAEAAML